MPAASAMRATCLASSREMPPGRPQFVRIETDPDRIVGTDARADAGNHLEQEAAAVFQRAAVFVIATVVIGRQESGNDVVVRGVDFHAVETGTLGAVGGGGEPFDHLGDVGLVHDANLDPGLVAALARTDEIG